MLSWLVFLTAYERNIFSRDVRGTWITSLHECINKNNVIKSAPAVAALCPFTSFTLFRPAPLQFNFFFSLSLFLSPLLVPSLLCHSAFFRSFFPFSRWSLVKSDTLCGQPWRIRHVETHRRHAIDERIDPRATSATSHPPFFFFFL